MAVGVRFLGLSTEIKIKSLYIDTVDCRTAVRFLGEASGNPRDIHINHVMWRIITVTWHRVLGKFSELYIDLNLPFLQQRIRQPPTHEPPTHALYSHRKH